MTRTMLGLALMVAVCTLGPGRCDAEPASGPHHTASPERSSSVLTGGYDGPNDASLDVQKLPENRVRFQVAALGATSLPGGPSTGDATGVVTVRNGAAVYRTEYGTLTFRFEGRKIRVVQSGDMGFGIGVDASGTYKWKRKKANIDPNLD